MSSEWSCGFRSPAKAAESGLSGAGSRRRARGGGSAKRGCGRRARPCRRPACPCRGRRLPRCAVEVRHARASARPRSGPLAQDGFDRRTGAFERSRQPRDLGGDVVDALAQQRVLHPLGRPGRSPHRASWPISRCNRLRSSIAAASWTSQLRDFGAEFRSTALLLRPPHFASPRADRSRVLRAASISLRSARDLSNSRSASSRPCSPSRASSSCTRRLRTSASVCLHDQLLFQLACRVRRGRSSLPRSSRQFLAAAFGFGRSRASRSSVGARRVRSRRR